MKEKKPAHRPLKYGEPTELVPVRMPISKKGEIKAMLKKYMKRFEEKKAQ